MNATRTARQNGPTHYGREAYEIVKLWDMKCWYMVGLVSYKPMISGSTKAEYVGYLPRTIPPFQITKKAKAATTAPYGRNDGSMSGTIWGALAIDLNKSPESGKVRAHLTRLARSVHAMIHT